MNERYGTTLIVLHWLTLLLIAAAFGVAEYLEDLPLSPSKLKLISWHKWVGMTVLFLLPLRAALRFSDRLGPARGLVWWESLASRWVHGALYLLMILVPLSGWLHSSAAGFPVVWLGWVPLPDLVDKDKALAHLFEELHEGGVNLLFILVLLHAGAALYHHHLRRDGVLVPHGPLGKEKDMMRLWRLPLLLLLALPAWAGEWKVDYARSEVRFTIKQMNVPVDGGFARFTIKADFDSGKPENGRFMAEVDMASISTGSEEGDAEVRRPAWFDTAKHPKARFEARKIRRDGPGRYTLLGDLTLKGRTKPFTAILLLSPQKDGGWLASGKFVLKRSDFEIGAGEWADPSVVANEVDGRFRVMLQP